MKDWYVAGYQGTAHLEWRNGYKWGDYTVIVKQHLDHPMWIVCHRNGQPDDKLNIPKNWCLGYVQKET